METQLDMPIFLGLPWQIQLAWTLKQTSEEYDEDDFFRAKYVHSQNVDEPVRMERPESPYTNNAYSRQEFYFHRDRLGNIAEITDFEGTVVQSYVYDAFGKVTIYDKDGNEITPSSANYLETPYAFTGRELDPETGLYFYRARYYDPNSGRFISEDPIGISGGDFNFYKYSVNNPANRIDPFGLQDFGYADDYVSILYDSPAALELNRDAENYGRAVQKGLKNLYIASGVIVVGGVIIYTAPVIASEVAYAFVFYPELATFVSVGFAGGVVKGITGADTKLLPSYPAEYIADELGFLLGKQIKRICE